jgi:hypothetical protein
MKRGVDNAGIQARQFESQRATPETHSTIERLLRNSRASFESIRALSPTRYRFHVVDRAGRDIRAIEIDNAAAKDSTRVESAKYTGQYSKPKCSRHISKNGIAETTGRYFAVGQQRTNGERNYGNSRC